MAPQAPDNDSVHSPATAVGSKAPAFALKDQAGKTHKLADYKGKWLVVYFYPRDNTPGCTKEACQFRDAYEGFGRINAAILGVSPDDEASHDRFIRKFNLPFPLLADTDRAMCQAYGVWQEKNMYGIKRMGVVRTTVLIDPQSRIAARWDKVKVQDHEQAVLEKIQTLQAASA